MDFRLDDALPVLRRTPAVLRSLLAELPASWTDANEGPGTWSPFDVVGHLIHGERTDWLVRVETILRHGDAVAFEPFDREAMFEASRGKSLAELLDTFEALRGTIAPLSSTATRRSPSRSSAISAGSASGAAVERTWPLTTICMGARKVERAMGIEPTLVAWEATVLPLNYTRA